MIVMDPDTSRRRRPLPDEQGASSASASPSSPHKQLKPDPSPNTLQQQWLECDRGTQMLDTTVPIIPMKMPISSTLSGSAASQHIDIDDVHQFTPDMMVRLQKSRKRRLVAVINVLPRTCGTPLYAEEEFRKHNVPVYSLSAMTSASEEAAEATETAGTDKQQALEQRFANASTAPTENELTVFAKLLDKLLSSIAAEEQDTAGGYQPCVAVHDFLSLDRTCTLLCFALVTELGWDVAASLDRLQKVRPPAIRSATCLHLLHQLLDEPVVPATTEEQDAEPAAHFNVGELLRIEPAATALTDSTLAVVTKLLDSENVSHVTRITRSLLQDERCHLRQHTAEYLCSWKPVGLRVQLLILATGCFLIDLPRAQVFPLTLWFPSSATAAKQVDRTLLDCEFVMDHDGEVRIPRLLILDMPALYNERLHRRTFTARLGLVQKEILEPRRRVPCPPTLVETCRVRLKDYSPITRWYRLATSFPAQLTHGFAGLVFVHSQSQYRCTAAAAAAADATEAMHLYQWNAPQLHVRIRVARDSLLTACWLRRATREVAVPLDSFRYPLPTEQLQQLATTGTKEESRVVQLQLNPPTAASSPSAPSWSLAAAAAAAATVPDSVDLLELLTSDEYLHLEQLRTLLATE